MNLTKYTQYCSGGIDQRDREIGGATLVISSIWPGDTEFGYSVQIIFLDSCGIKLKQEYPHRVHNDSELKTAEDWLIGFYNRHSKS
jgi:hypothetical protein